MQNLSQCREKTEGWLGRKRTYICRQCHLKFQVDRLAPLPKNERICHHCKDGYPFTFTAKQTGQDVVVKASDSELATLRAWQINPNLTFKVPQPKQ